MTLLVVAALPGLVMLGVWQLDRAAEKRALQNRFMERQGLPARDPPRSLEDADFLRVRIEGVYERAANGPRQYLVDNRVHRGAPGYWVVTTFAAHDGRRYLVNRGWTAAPGSREELPAVPAPQGPQRLVGVVWPDLGLPPLLAADPWPETWPRRVQRLDVARMAAGDEAVVAAEIRLEAGQPGVLAAAPLAVDFRAERHQGYAAQWFGLALVLAIGYLVFGFARS